MDSITKADGMEGVRLVHFPGSVRMRLGADTVALMADALEQHAAELWRGAAGRIGSAWDMQRADASKAQMLADVLRGSGEVCADMDKDDDDTHALVRALVNAGAQA